MTYGRDAIQFALSNGGQTRNLPSDADFYRSALRELTEECVALASNKDVERITINEALEAMSPVPVRVVAKNASDDADDSACTLAGVPYAISTLAAEYGMRLCVDIHPLAHMWLGLGVVQGEWNQLAEDLCIQHSVPTAVVTLLMNGGYTVARQ